MKAACNHQLQMPAAVIAVSSYKDHTASIIFPGLVLSQAQRCAIFTLQKAAHAKWNSAHATAPSTC